MVLACAIFVVVFMTVMGCVALGFSFLKSKQKRQIRSMLLKAEASPTEQRASQLMRPPEIQDSLTKILHRFRFLDKLNQVLEQAGKERSGTRLIVLSCIMAIIGLVASTRLRLEFHPVLISLVVGLGAGSAPLLLLLRQRRKNFAAFEEQFPEALDFLSRSMRAGHGFSIALEMLGTDSPDPLGRAFRRVSNELQLGSSLDTAMGKLLSVVPLVDVRFFISSVLIQQETGGNLGEILSKLSHVIRERFRIKGQVKAASAHGRITGLVLVLMPAAVTAFMMMTNPEYLTEMAHDPTGLRLIYGGIGAQIVGFFVIRKIINIKV